MHVTEHTRPLGVVMAILTAIAAATAGVILAAAIGLAFSGV